MDARRLEAIVCFPDVLLRRRSFALLSLLSLSALFSRCLPACLSGEPWMSCSRILILFRFARQIFTTPYSLSFFQSLYLSRGSSFSRFLSHLCVTRVSKSSKTRFRFSSRECRHDCRLPSSSRLARRGSHEERERETKRLLLTDWRNQHTHPPTHPHVCL